MKALSSKVHNAATLALLICAGAFSGCGPLDRPPDFETRLARFEASLDSLRRAKQIPGLSVAVIRDQDVVLARGFGHATLDPETPATQHTVYRIASVSKTIAGTLAMKLVEQGLLDLDEPMSETPGFMDFCQGFRRTGSIFARDYACGDGTLTLRQHLGHTVDGPGGEQFRYNPVAFSWTSRTMAFRAGKAYSDLVRELIFEPCGMTSSARIHRDLALPAALEARLAPPHRVDEHGAVVRSPQLQPQGDGAAGGIVSTVLDLAAFDIALDRGEIISTASKAEMFEPAVTSTGQTLPYGVGWYVTDFDDLRLWWHTGWWERAYSALYLKVPEKNMTLILLANSEGIWWNNPLDGAELERSEFGMAFLNELIE